MRTQAQAYNKHSGAQRLYKHFMIGILVALFGLFFLTGYNLVMALTQPLGRYQVTSCLTNNKTSSTDLDGNIRVNYVVSWQANGRECSGRMQYDDFVSQLEADVWLKNDHSGLCYIRVGRGCYLPQYQRSTIEYHYRYWYYSVASLGLLGLTSWLFFKFLVMEKDFTQMD